MSALHLITLAHYTAPGLILPELAAGPMAWVMRQMTDAVRREDGTLPDQLSSSLTALNRELLTSTRLGSGAVLPQVHAAALSRPRFALGHTAQPLSWLAEGFPPIDLVFLVLMPARTNLESEHLVGTLQNLDKPQLDRLRRAGTVSELYGFMAEIRVMPLKELPHVPAMAPDAQYRAHFGAVNYRRWRRS